LLVEVGGSVPNEGVLIVMNGWKTIDDARRDGAVSNVLVHLG